MTMIDTPEGIEAFAKLQTYYALKLEVRTGMRFSSRGSVAQLIRDRYGYTQRRKADLLYAFEADLIAGGVLRRPDRPLPEQIVM